MIYGNYHQREILPSNHDDAWKNISPWSMIGYLADKISQWQRIVRYESAIEHPTTTMTQRILRGKHILLCHAMKVISPRCSVGGGGGEACVVPYMGGNWAPDYVPASHRAWIYKHVFYSDRWMSDGWHMSLGVYIANQLNICVQV